MWKLKKEVCTTNLERPTTKNGPRTSVRVPDLRKASVELICALRHAGLGNFMCHEARVVRGAY